MRQTNVCLNRVLKFYVNLFYVNLCPGGSCKPLYSRKKCALKIERKIKNDGRFIQLVTRKMRAR